MKELRRNIAGIKVTRSSMPELNEYIEEIKDIWDSHWLTNMGPKHKELQEKLESFLGVENVELMTNGHMALELTLQAMNLQGEGLVLLGMQPVLVFMPQKCLTALKGERSVIGINDGEMSYMN